MRLHGEFQKEEEISVTGLLCEAYHIKGLYCEQDAVSRLFLVVVHVIFSWLYVLQQVF